MVLIMMSNQKQNNNLVCRFVEEQSDIIGLLDTFYRKEIKGKIILNFDGKGNILPELNVNSSNLYAVMNLTMLVKKNN